MSETEQREIEMVAGVIEGVTQKKPDTWQVAVKPDGSQYAKNLWTKDSELVQALTEKLGQHGAFVCSASYWNRADGQQVRSLWINEHADPGQLEDLHLDMRQNATPSGHSQSQPKSSSDSMTPEKWDAKERRDYRSRAWAQTLAAFQHTIAVAEDPQDVFVRLQPFQRKVYEDVCGMFAYPPDQEDIPF